MTTFLSALDTSILSTALPTISKDLGAGPLYIWITNAYVLSSTVTQPLFGQSANIFGRRWLLILSVVWFAVGSGLAGGANGTIVIILGRTIQGIGGGGINTLIDIVIGDLVPMRERGKYVALMGVIWAIGTVIGPVLGGSLAEHASWRWIFYINLPLSGLSLILLYFFLRVASPPGFTGSILIYWVGYFLPVYFQAVLGTSATKSGLFVLPITGAVAPFGILAGILISVWGKYRAFHFIGFGLMSIAVGLFSILDQHSSAEYWAGFQIIFGAGSGLIYSSTLPPIQASLHESDMATATATWAFMRSFGSIWGVAIPTAIFNEKIESLLGGISDPSLRHQLSNGGAYALASSGLSSSLMHDPKLLSEVIGLYTQSLRFVWLLAIPFGICGFVASLPIRQLELKTHLETEFGLQEQ
ncbi:major facilitator transporter [Trichophyton tonsurans CBS 112818]|uniref:Major facilitator transporter n=1 Tax=Trichophyton tonsurans (strain CBS 112818) TaxID=647933 RepID=F2S6M7_TRIT1|nr:major facilitator transporter [Trichophyton tonsurans CBS 112818]